MRKHWVIKIYSSKPMNKLEIKLSNLPRDD